ncbi:MAG: GGDEF domain-containing protein [Rhizobiaceae bacterium]|nr:GGDEF domain-containing protein [Rhizobiaceae bacterium]
MSTQQTDSGWLKARGESAACWDRPSLTPREEAVYFVQTNAGSRRLLAIALAAGAAAYLVNHAGDYFIAGANIDALLMLRLCVACLLLVVLGLVRVYEEVDLSTFFILSATVASAGNTAIALTLPAETAFWLAASQMSVAVVAVFVLTRLRDLLLVAALLVMLPLSLNQIFGSENIVAQTLLLAVTLAVMTIFGVLIDNQRRRLFQLANQLDYAATHDPLTGVCNRGEIFRQLKRELDRAGRSGTPLSVLSVDIDHFKAINDGYGHAAGDRVLKEVAARMTTLVRPSDALGRVGGEEFMIVLPATCVVGAKYLAERLRSGIEQVAIPWDDRTIRCTISIGVAQSGANEQSEVLYTRADEALYTAKSAGRNCLAANNTDRQIS